MQRLEVSGAVRPIYGSLGVKRLIIMKSCKWFGMVLHLSYCTAGCQKEVCAHSPRQQFRQVLRVSCIVTTACVAVDDGCWRLFMWSLRIDHCAVSTLDTLVTNSRCGQSNTHTHQHISRVPFWQITGLCNICLTLILLMWRIG